MYNEELEKLIELALLDGELTEKEKQILFKKAQLLNVDLDEFEMVLDAKLYEKKQSMHQQGQAESAPKSDKYGDVKKCPSCGSLVSSFNSKCIDCGHEFSGIQANASINKLFQLLTDVDTKFSNEGNSNLGSLITGIFSRGNKAIDIIRTKTEIIKSFPVPNTKDDIIEFITAAFPYAKKVKKGFSAIFASEDWSPGSSQHLEQELSKAWHYKCEQVILKARFTLKDDQKSLDEINDYAKKLKIK